MLRNKNIIITGSNRGIGKAILEVCSSFGANIFAHTRKQTEEFETLTKELKNKYNTKIYPIYFDISNREEIRNGIKEINSYKIPIDGLINNAGSIVNKSFLMTTIEDIQNQIDINFKSLFFISQAVSKMMIRNNKGSIINMSSIAGRGGKYGKSAYGASKAAISSLTKTMAEELGIYGIRVNALAPGFIDTDMAKNIPQESIDETIKLSKLKRIGTPKEVANIAAFLCSDLSSYITGEIINVSGGLE